jgi:hypothetical protein
MATTLPNPFDPQQNKVAAIPSILTPAASIGAPSMTSVQNVTPQAIGDVSKANSTGYSSTDIGVTPDQTVEGRVNGIIASNSPLMQQAQSRALQQANSRGLINSSIAESAGQSAVLDAATNIAKQDAQTYANAASQNAGAKTAASQFGATASNTINLANAGAENSAATANAKAANDAQLANQDAINKASTANLGVAGNLNIANLEAQYKNLTQASSSAASIMNNTQTMVNNIMQDKNLDAAAKQAAIDKYNASSNRAIQIIGAIAGDVDLSSYLDEILGMTTPTNKQLSPATSAKW